VNRCLVTPLVNLMLFLLPGFASIGDSSIFCNSCCCCGEDRAEILEDEESTCCEDRDLAPQTPRDGVARKVQSVCCDGATFPYWRLIFLQSAAADPDAKLETEADLPVPPELSPRKPDSTLVSILPLNYDFAAIMKNEQTPNSDGLAPLPVFRSARSTIERERDEAKEIITPTFGPRGLDYGFRNTLERSVAEQQGPRIPTLESQDTLGHAMRDCREDTLER